MELDWLPDWKDETQYPVPDETSLEQWAWEFLRRNIKYQETWNTLVNTTSPYKVLSEMFPLIDKELITDDSIQKQVVAEHFENEFNLILIGDNTIPSPAWEYEQGVISFKCQAFEITPSVSKRKQQPRESEREPYILNIKSNDDLTATVIFDLTLPLAPQLKNAGFALQKIAKDRSIKQPKDRSDKYQEYLRILDAKATGVTNGGVADHLYPKERIRSPITNSKVNSSECPAYAKVNNGYERALALRDKGYHLIPLKSVKPKSSK